MAHVMHPIIRDLIKHENDLVNQRLGWLIQIQGLLFAALAFAWKENLELTILLSTLGIATAASLGSAIWLYSPAVRGLDDWWKDHRPLDMADAPFIMGLSRRSHGIWWFLRPWRALPVIFVVAWIGVLALKFLLKA